MHSFLFITCIWVIMVNEEISEYALTLLGYVLQFYTEAI